MNEQLKRRDLLALMGVGGLVFASGLAGCGERAAAAPPTMAGTGGPPPPPPPSNDFFFLQLSDTHVGYQGPANPEAAGTLEHAVATINGVDTQPDFIVFTGDLTHTTDDDAERRARMARFKQTVAGLKVKNLRFLPGEHDAGPDHGAAYREVFGDLHYSFDHKGVHFVALDNVSRAGSGMGDEQLDWLTKDLAAVPATTPLVVLAHRPLFDLQPDWDWFTKDGARAIEILSRRDQVTVFYGHIHQELHRTTGKIAHHSARSLVFPLPAPGSQPKRAPLPWDPASSDHGLGWRGVALASAEPRITEVPYR
ncbi:MAG TPA: metallophosphoesterase [Polyangiaceae bacterium]|jgi:3',5'-cyclic AMP phosphodiesterase CpdA|nr:metallophosphoesterase [Polyangiaceae bacterium]